MTKKFILCTIFFFSFLTISCTQFKDKTWSNENIVAPKYGEVINQLEQYLDSKNFTGTVLIGKDKEILFAKGYGTCDKKAKSANVENININTTFEAGSITKQFTAVAIMQLAEVKKINIDEKISKFFPEYEHGDEITIRMLLNMRSGLVDYINSSDEFFSKKVAADIDKKILKGQKVDDEIVLKHFYNAPLMAKPDSVSFYCNTNYFLLAKIIEQVSGISYCEYVQKNILEKCGMNNSNFEFLQTKAKGYDKKGRYYSLGSDFALGVGNLNSTVTDLFKWNYLLTHGKVVSKKSFKKMIDTSSYGFGLYRRGDLLFHSGVTNVFNSYNSFHLGENLSIIVLTNTPVNEINATYIATDLYKIWEENTVQKKRIK